jgi:Polyketide cyclase / dehydrase and lipid transport
MVLLIALSRGAAVYTWTHTVTTTAAPEKVWPLYADVARWREWDHGLVAVTLDGPFAVGSTGTLAVEGQPPLAWRLVDVKENALFTDVTEIPDVATLTFVHRIEAIPTGSRITHEVHIDGPAADGLGAMVTSDTPEAMAELVRIAEAS